MLCSRCYFRLKAEAEAKTAKKSGGASAKKAGAAQTSAKTNGAALSGVGTVVNAVKERLKQAAAAVRKGSTADSAPNNGINMQIGRAHV